MNKKTNKQQIKNIKIAKLKFLESKLQLETKNGADTKTIYTIMKDINKIKREIQM